MKKAVWSLFCAMILITLATMAQAATYSFDVRAGSLDLTIGKGYSRLSLDTPTPILVGYDEYPELDGGKDFDYTIVADLSVSYSVPAFGLNDSLAFNDALNLGLFQGIDLKDIMTPGDTASYFGDETITGQYGGYMLNNANLHYDVELANDDIARTISIDINDITLSGGNTSDFLSELIPSLTNEFIGIDPSLVLFFTDLTVGFSLETGSKLAMDAAAVPIPSAMVLLGFGLIGLAGVQRRQ